MGMCISVKKIQRTKFDVSQKPQIQKMHTEPEILNWMVGGVICHSDLLLCDSPTRSLDLRSLSYGELWGAMGSYGPGVTYTVPRRATTNAPPPMGLLFGIWHLMSFGHTNALLQPHHVLVT